MYFSYFTPLCLRAVCRHPDTASDSGGLPELHFSSSGRRRESVPHRLGKDLKTLYMLVNILTRAGTTYTVSVRAPFTHRTHSDGKWALSGPVRSVEQAELLVAVPRARLNTVVISPPLFGLSERLLVNLGAPKRGHCYCIWLVWRTRGT